MLSEIAKGIGCCTLPVPGWSRCQDFSEKKTCPKWSALRPLQLHGSLRIPALEILPRIRRFFALTLFGPRPAAFYAAHALWQRKQPDTRVQLRRRRTQRGEEQYLWWHASLAANMARSHKENGWCVQVRGPQLPPGGKVENLPIHSYDVGRGKQMKIPTEVLSPGNARIRIRRTRLHPAELLQEQRLRLLLLGQLDAKTHRVR